MLFNNFSRYWRQDVAIDLGTATTRVAVAHSDYRYTVPSSYQAIPALAHGVVVNVDAATEALRPALHRLRSYGVLRPRVLACAPSDTSPEERNAVIESCYRAGAASVILIPEPVAAAMGDGIDYQSSLPTLLMDVGEGVTDCAIVRQGRLSTSFASRVACADLRSAASSAVQQWNGITITESEAMRLINAVGINGPLLDEDDLPSLRFVSIQNTTDQEKTFIPVGVLQEAIEPIASRLIDTVSQLLQQAPELHRELSDSGIRLSGGGALIPGLAKRVEETVGLSVYVVRDPLNAVIQGAKRILPIAAEHDLWHQVGKPSR